MGNHGLDLLSWCGRWIARSRQVSQVVALDKSILKERVGRLSAAKLELVLAGIDTVLGR